MTSDQENADADLREGKRRLARGRVNEALRSLAPVGTTRLDYAARVLTTAAEHDISVLVDGVVSYLEVSTELVDAATEHRVASYLPGEGTWFTLRVYVDFDESGEPEFEYCPDGGFPIRWRVPVPDSCYVADQERFPVGEDYMLTWLDEILVRAQTQSADEESRGGAR